MIMWELGDLMFTRMEPESITENIRMMQLQDEDRNTLSEERWKASGDA